MNRFDLLMLGTVGLTIVAYVAGYLRGKRKGLKKGANVIKALPFN